MPDPRFDRLRTDPRFRHPKKKQSRVVVDDRFKSLLTHEEKRKSDLARGEVLLESSDEENEKLGKNIVGAKESDGSSQPNGIIKIGGDPKADDEDEEPNINLDENFADLDAQALAYSRAHPEEAGHGHREDGQRTRRLAAVNLDWDHVRATHLYKICSSLVSPTAPLTPMSNAGSSMEGNRGTGGANSVVRGQVLSVHIYPSLFGKERVAKEEKEGPPADIFKKRKDDDEVNEKNIYDVGDGVDYDERALRNYQLERLRYYYAIITCDTANTAFHIYSELDGTELERSANVIDLSFVPDDMAFDEECRDEATELDLGSTYKPLDFSTDALRHSKVKLTWDDDDPERNQITRRMLTRKEVEEADFRAYLASSSSESEDLVEAVNLGARKVSKKATERKRLRALLLGGRSDQIPEGWLQDEKVFDGVDMEITFTPGLIEKKGEEHETTLEKYRKKIQEKRKKRKEEKKTEQENGKKMVAQGDEFFAADSGDESRRETEEEDRGDNGKKNHAKRSGEAAQARTPISAEELALLVAANKPNSEPKHFNLKSVIKAEKRKGKKGKGKMKQDEESEVQEDFVIDVSDERFKALHEDPQFAIDPSNPKFKKTKSMAALLDERSRRQHKLREKAECDTSKSSTSPAGRDLQSLVESVKRKSVNVEQRLGKRRKL